VTREGPTGSPCRSAVPHRHTSGIAQRTVLVGLTAAGLVALAVAFVVGRSDRSPGPVRPPQADLAPAETVRESDAGARAAPLVGEADIVLVSGDETGRFDASAIPADEPVTVDLTLPFAIDESTDVVGSRILRVDRRPPVELDGVVHGTARRTIRLEVPAGWLVPGGYLIEVKTTEKSHMPLRRFALEIE